MGLRDRLSGLRDRFERSGDDGLDDDLDDDRDDDELDDADQLPPAQSPEELTARLRALGLGAYAADLAAAGRRGVRLVPADEGVAAGSSRLGGAPDLPPDTAWPRHEGAPLSFIAQLDLAGLRASLGRDADLLADLPPTGLLSFFALVDDSTGYGLVHEDRGSYRVLHHDTTTVPVPLPAELEQEARLKPLAVAAMADWTPAPYESAVVEEILGAAEDDGGLDDDVDVADYLEAMGDDEDLDLPPRHRFLGNPDQIQGDLGWEAADEAGGDPGDWRLLLQVDSDEDSLGVDWGDVGRLYWLIREDDLRAQHWDRVQLIGQCY